MSTSTREQLIGYLLGAIEPDESALVEQHLASDETARRELELLRSSLHPLAEDRAQHEPPTGLAQRCCDYVYSRTEVMPAALSPASNASPRVTRHWTWLELSVAGAIAAAVAIFLVPQIYESHVQSQILACQNNLKDINFASADYGNHNGGYYPAVQPGDHINAVGMWAPKLVDQHYLTQPAKTLICPSSSNADSSKFNVPTAAELEAMTQERLDAVRSQLSGSYGGPVGYMDNGQYKLRRNQGSAKVGIFADTPGPNGTNSPNHGGRGQNVGWDDGHTSFLTTPEVGPNGDNIYLNDNHEIAPGLRPDDTVIESSQQPALPPKP